jgi:hypothetical protein
MADTIWGQIHRILGPDRFELLVTREGHGNALDYGPLERIRIATLTDPEMDGFKMPDPDRPRLLDKKVRCAVLGRESTNTLVADVTVL